MYARRAIGQDVEDVRMRATPLGPDLVVVACVTRASITSPVQKIVRTGRLVDLRADEVM